MFFASSAVSLPKSTVQYQNASLAISVQTILENLLAVYGSSAGLCVMATFVALSYSMTALPFQDWDEMSSSLHGLDHEPVTSIGGESCVQGKPPQPSVASLVSSAV